MWMNGEYFVIFEGIWNVLNFWKVWFKKERKKFADWLLAGMLGGTVGTAGGPRMRLAPNTRG